jgi:hypothetical protein
MMTIKPHPGPSPQGRGSDIRLFLKVFSFGEDLGEANCYKQPSTLLVRIIIRFSLKML